MAGSPYPNLPVQVGSTIAHYRLVQKIGSRGMGDVYVVEDTKLHRRVALKVLPSDVAADAARRARFIREARALAALDHPNIVTVHSVEDAEGLYFLTMCLCFERHRHPGTTYNTAPERRSA